MFVYLHPRRRRHLEKAGVLIIVVVLFGCARANDSQSSQLLSQAAILQQNAAACMQSINSNVRYNSLSRALPLTTPYRASVAQMTNTAFADDDQIHALPGWTQDVQKCRDEVILYVRQNSPISLALILSSWADRDEVYVNVIQRKTALGAAATHLRTIQIKLLSSLTDRSIQIDAQLSSERQAELSRRVAILDALTNLAP